jgi:hypothetical protein
VRWHHYPRKGAHLGERKEGRPAKEGLWGVGKGVKGTPRVQEGNPLPIFGTCGLVRERGGCNHHRGRTNKAGREGIRRGSS